MDSFWWFTAGLALGPTVHTTVRVMSKILINAYMRSKQKPS